MNANEIKQIVKEAVSEALEEKKKQDSFNLMNLLTAYEANVHTTTFYNPAISTFGMSISASRGSVQIYMAPPIDKNVRGFAKPGEKRYDHDKNFVFGLTLNECHAILENFNSLINGTWERTQEPGKPPIDERYKHNMEFQHQTRKFSIGPVKDNMQRNTLRIAIYDPERQGSLGYILRPNTGEVDIFKSYMHNAVVLLPFMLSLFGGVVKSMKSAIFSVNTNAPKSNGNSNGNSQDGFYSNKNTAKENMWSETTGSAPTNEEPAPWEDVPPSEIPPWEDVPEQKSPIGSFLVDKDSQKNQTSQTDSINPEEVGWNF